MAGEHLQVLVSYDDDHEWSFSYYDCGFPMPNVGDSVTIPVEGISDEGTLEGKLVFGQFRVIARDFAFYDGPVWGPGAGSYRKKSLGVTLAVEPLNDAAVRAVKEA